MKMMNDKLLKKIYRYDNELKVYNVDIELDEYRDVYSEWDYSPFINRDLDEDLLEYLMECSLEISHKRKMIINFFLPEALFDLKREERSKEGFKHYFAYRIRKMTYSKWSLVKNSLIFGLLGSIFLISSYFIELRASEAVFLKLISEGLIIGAWVSIWEIFSIFFFQINDLSIKLKHYNRLKAMPIKYYYK